MHQGHNSRTLGLGIDPADLIRVPDGPPGRARHHPLPVPGNPRCAEKMLIVLWCHRHNRAGHLVGLRPRVFPGYLPLVRILGPLGGVPDLHGVVGVAGSEHRQADPWVPSTTAPVPGVARTSVCLIDLPLRRLRVLMDECG